MTYYYVVMIGAGCLLVHLVVGSVKVAASLSLSLSLSQSSLRKFRSRYGSTRLGKHFKTCQLA